jgi:hypothetical protein
MMNLRSAKYVNKPPEAHVKEPNKKHGKDHAEEISRSRGRDQGKEAHQPTGTTPDILAVEDVLSRRVVSSLPYEDRHRPGREREVRQMPLGLNSGTSAAQEERVPRGIYPIPRGMLYHTDELVPPGVYPIPLGSPRECAHKAAQGAPHRRAKPAAEDEVRRQKKIWRLMTH